METEILKNSLLLKSVGEIASENPEKIEVFKKYGVDFCCGGGKTLAEACKEYGIDETLVAGALNAVEETGKGEGVNYAPNQNIKDWDTGFLIDYIVRSHHEFLRKYLPEGSEYIEKIANVHGKGHPEIIKIGELYVKMAYEIMLHLDKEERELFPDIKNKRTAEVKKEILEAENDHESIGLILKEMNLLSSGYSVPEDACASYRHAYKLLKNISDDIMMHVHLENNILFKRI